MKKSTLLLAGLMGLATAHADEGMWTLYNLPDAVYEQMVAEGFQLPCDQLYSGDQALKNCVVNFSGYCSGVVVSPNGLVFTNHHCGFSAINSHSTVEHDYMLNGFYAKSYAEELPNKDMFVSFMKSQQDVTKRVQSALDAYAGDDEYTVIDSLTQVLTDSVRKIDKTLHVEIDAFYEGNKYYATTYQQFNDLRLVFTVPKSMGKFGGETDNWMWPRQTCDFSVFRIYADPNTNGPADYSEQNVPYRPKSWAPVSLNGYDEGSFSMTVGYPGSTSRYLSSYGIQEMRDQSNAPRVEIRGRKQAVMEKYMAMDEQTRINYEDAYVGSANYWKNSMGMNKCIDSIGIVQNKVELEKKIRAWQDTAQVCCLEKVDFDVLQQLYADRAEAYHENTVLRECMRRNTEMLNRALMLATPQPNNPEASEKEQYVEFEDNYDKWNPALDKELTATMLKTYAEMSTKFKDWDLYKNTISKKYKGDIDKYVDDLYKKSKVLVKGARFYPHSKKYNKDMGVELGQNIMIALFTNVSEILPSVDSIENEERKLCAAKVRMEEEQPHYSDANFTMRLSYGQVTPLTVGSASMGYYTTPESILEKMEQGDRIADYYAEPVMKELLGTKDFGRYADNKSGTLQLCFLTNNDITGGNSGSPMFDGKGRLIGLAFDGNWDSLSSDINFDHVLARCIGVDIRYVLYLMDKWGHADRLLDEIAPIKD